MASCSQVNRPYPAGHNDLINRVAIAGGAIVSELAPGAAPTKWRFAARARVLGGLSQASVIVEAGWRSGSLLLAAETAQLGRRVGAVPGPITSSWSIGYVAGWAGGDVDLIRSVASNVLRAVNAIADAMLGDEDQAPAA